MYIKVCTNTRRLASIHEIDSVTIPSPPECDFAALGRNNDRFHPVSYGEHVLQVVHPQVGGVGDVDETPGRKPKRRSVPHQYAIPIPAAVLAMKESLKLGFFFFSQLQPEGEIIDEGLDPSR